MKLGLIKKNPVHREVRRDTKCDKRRFVDLSICLLAQETETAAEHLRMKVLCEITRKSSGKQCASSKPIKDTADNKLTRKPDQTNRWAEYFNSLLNQTSPSDVADIPDAPAFGINVKTAKPTIGEIKIG